MIIKVLINFSILKQNKIYYWSPSLVNIATNRAVINSAYAIKKYYKNTECSIVNFFGEFERFKASILKKKIKLIYKYNPSIFKYLPKEGKIPSRFSYIIIFLTSFLPLKKLIRNDKPDYLIIHLITSLPLILLLMYKFETKFILRISGYPRMNFLRKILWRFAFKKIYAVTCPTKNTLNYIKNLDLIEESKIILLYDPILNVAEINKKKNEKKVEFKNYYLAVGRLTKQKNFLFLCKAFKKIIEKDHKAKLLIAGEVEDEKILKKFVKINKLEKNIFFLGFVNNIYPYFYNSKGFILSSLWEDPGFVLVEAGFCRTPILSSDAWPGPTELIQNCYNGIIFKNNDTDDFIKNFELINDLKIKHFIKLNKLKSIKKFTIYSHYKNLKKILHLA